ncbi:MAG: L-fuco-beta-pyranose dehydrogenase [Rhodanobacteraceae bacterium]|jgi:D-threo-aldose 1-dehydrogenase|nr:MAG: L-fuco-beta-pyranose dehydrogenase [Rhodanobacteraceae bacterium]
MAIDAVRRLPGVAPRAYVAARVRVAGLGFGTAPVGNLYAEVGEDEARDALERALRLGVRYFDTAPFYGHGLAERRLGRALSGSRRDGFAVSTKVGRCIECDPARREAITDGFAVHGSRAVFDYSRDGVLRSFEASLERLGLDRVDILFLHDVGRLTHGDNHPRMLRQALDEALPAMADLRTQGVVDAIGIGVNEVEVCRELMPRFDLDCIMLAGRYTLFEQAPALTILDEAHRRKVKVIVAGPYNSGLLGDPHGPGSTYNYAPADPGTLERARRIYAICAEEGVDVGAVALQFPAVHPAVCAVVAGMRNVMEVESALARSSQRLPSRIWPRLRGAGIIDAAAPVPGVPA